MSHAVYEDMLMKITSLLFAAALAAQADAASSLPPPPVLPYGGAPFAQLFSPAARSRPPRASARRKQQIL